MLRVKVVPLSGRPSFLGSWCWVEPNTRTYCHYCPAGCVAFCCAPILHQTSSKSNSNLTTENQMAHKLLQKAFSTMAAHNPTTPTQHIPLHQQKHVLQLNNSTHIPLLGFGYDNGMTHNNWFLVHGRRLQQ